MEDLTGKQFGQYRITAPLGEGGMAAVYKAYQASVDRYVALKVLPRHYAADQSFVRRFEQEAKVIASLEHPNILPVHDFGEAEGYTYIVMRFVDSGTLTEYLKGRQPSLEEISRILVQIAGALDYAHSRGIIHRDIKPSNVLMDQQGNCLLTDFGLAKVLLSSAKFTTSGAFIGTPTYASPEQCLGAELDRRSDIYSLGVMLYEMTIGRPPFDAETPMAVVIKHIHDPLPIPRMINPNLPDSIERVILKALAKNPDERYQSAGELAQAFVNAVTEAGVALPATWSAPARVPTPPPGTVLPAGRPPSSPPGAASRPPSSPPARPSSPPVSPRPHLPWWGVALGCLAALGVFFGLGVVGVVLLGAVLDGPEQPTLELVVAARPRMTATETAPALAAPPAEPATLTPAPLQETILELATATTSSGNLLATSVPQPTLPGSGALSTSSPASASDEPQWAAILDLPRAVNAFLVDPGHTETIYAATGDYLGSGAGLYRSDDSGVTWQRIGLDLPNEQVSALAFISDPPTVYAAVGKEIYSSLDNGESWTLQGVCDLLMYGLKRRLIPSASGQVLFMLSEDSGLARSTDGGQTCLTTGQGLPTGGSGGAAILSLAVDPADDDVVYAGTSGSGVYKSTDGGKTWDAANKGMLDYGISALLVDPGDSQVIYAGGASGEMFQSADGGESWENLTDQFHSQISQSPGRVRELITILDVSGVVLMLADTTGAIAYSEGEWFETGNPPGQEYPWFTAFAVTLNAAGDDAVLLVAIDGKGVFRLAQGQEAAAQPALPDPESEAEPVFVDGTWREIDDLPRSINALAADPTDAQVLYAATGQMGASGSVYRSADGGQTWQTAANHGLPDDIVTAVTVAPDGTVLAISGAFGKVYSSGDGGESWDLLAEELPWFGFQLRLAFAPDGTIYLISIPGGLARSQDGGQSWQIVSAGLPQKDGEIYALSISFDPADPQVIYVGTGGFLGDGYGVYKSTDGGESFSPSNRGMLDLRITTLAVDPDDPQVIYAGGEGGVFFKSLDGGQNWYDLSANILGFEYYLGEISLLAMDPAAPQLLYAVADLKGVLYSPDGGLTWLPLGNPPRQDQPMYSAALIQYGDNPVLIVAVQDAGAWEYENTP